MRRLRDLALLIAWAGLVWMVFARASDAPLFGNLIADLAYNVGLLAVAVVTVLAAVVTAGRLFRPSALILFGLAALVIVALAAADMFWLREVIAQP